MQAGMLNTLFLPHTHACEVIEQRCKIQQQEQCLQVFPPPNHNCKGNTQSACFNALKQLGFGEESFELCLLVQWGECE